MNTFEITGMHTAFQAILKQSAVPDCHFAFCLNLDVSTPTTKLLHSSSKARQSHIAFYCVYRSVRVHIRTDGDFTREVDDDVQRIRVYFSTNPQIVNESNGFDLASVISDLNVAVDNFNRRGSGFVLESIKHFVICITQYRPLHGGSSNIHTHVCYSCLHPFTNASALDKHTPYCTVHDAQQVVYPDPKNEDDCTLKYRSYRKQHPIPVHLICDFESFLTPVDDGEEEEDLRGMRVIDEHRISGFCCYRVTKYESYQKPPVVYSGPDVMTHFL